MIEPLCATDSLDATAQEFQGFFALDKNGFVEAANCFIGRFR